MTEVEGPMTEVMNPSLGKGPIEPKIADETPLWAPDYRPKVGS